jgi:hypothetical protein
MPIFSVSFQYGTHGSCTAQAMMVTLHGDNNNNNHNNTTNNCHSQQQPSLLLAL